MIRDHRWNGVEAAQFAAKTGWSIFPVSALKRPVMAGSWKDYSTNNQREIRKMFGMERRFHLAVDLGKSGLVVFDQDLELDQPDQVLKALHDADTLTLASINRELPHWYFSQPHGRPMGNSVWAGGDVKGAGGYVVVSKHEAINEAPVAPVPPVLVVSRAVADRRAIPSETVEDGVDGPEDGQVDVDTVARYLGLSTALVQAVLETAGVIRKVELPDPKPLEQMTVDDLLHNYEWLHQVGAKDGMWRTR